jgi:hypothetical protein
MNICVVVEDPRLREASPEYQTYSLAAPAKLRRPGGPEYVETERDGYRFVRPRENAGRNRLMQIAVGFLEGGSR